jgi:hypothetical protein
MINRTKSNVIAIKDMARTGRSLLSGDISGALIKGGGESGLTLKTKLNSM